MIIVVDADGMIDEMIIEKIDDDDMRMDVNK